MLIDKINSTIDWGDLDFRFSIFDFSLQSGRCSKNGACGKRQYCFELRIATDNKRPAVIEGPSTFFKLGGAVRIRDFVFLVGISRNHSELLGITRDRSESGETGTRSGRG